LTMRMALSGALNQENLILVQKGLIDALNSTQIWVCLKLPVEWIREACITAASQIHYQSMGLLLKSLNEWINNNIKKTKRKVRDRYMSDICKMLRTLSQNTEFTRAIQEPETFAAVFSLLEMIKEYINDLDSKSKSPSAIFGYKCTELNFCIII